MSTNLFLHVKVRLGRRTLDHEIADGLPLDISPARTLRARQLAAPRERHAIAACLANILDAAEERHVAPGPRLVLDQARIIAARGEISTLIDLLRSDALTDPRAVAAARLLSDAL